MIQPIRDSVVNRLTITGGGGGGVTTLNTRSGALTLTSAGGTVTITSPTTSTINLEAVGGSGSPGGSSGQFQYNNAGAFGGTAAVVYATSGTHVTVTAQAIADIPLSLVGFSSGTADVQRWAGAAGLGTISVNSDSQFAAKLGSTSSPGYAFSGQTNSGFLYSTGVVTTVAGSQKLRVGTGSQVVIRNDGIYGFSATTAVTSAPDSAFARLGAASMAATDGSTGRASLEVLDEVYGVGWNGSIQTPTKNAVYDKIQVIAIFPMGFTAFDQTAVPVGQIKGYFTSPAPGNITAWIISSQGGGTCTIKVWKIANGTAVPTVADSINTSGLSLVTGSHVRSTSLTDFTTTSVALGDIFAYEITAISGVTNMSFNLEVTK